MTLWHAERVARRDYTLAGSYMPTYYVYSNITYYVVYSHVAVGMDGGEGIHRTYIVQTIHT